MPVGLNLNTDLLINEEHHSRGFVPVGGSFTNVPCVEVVFSDIESRLVQLVTGADVVCGVIAWLTNERLLRALATTRFASIIVQKEDFLRPDAEGVSSAQWKARLHALYARVPEFLERHMGVPEPVGGMSCCGDPTIQGVRCAGQRLAGGIGARVHHKFIVLGRYVEGVRPSMDDWLVDPSPINMADEDPNLDPVQWAQWEPDRVEPYAVATGSYNWTETANRSRENIVIIHDGGIAARYMTEWANMCAISEPLDWNAEYVAPEWRIGT